MIAGLLVWDAWGDLLPLFSFAVKVSKLYRRQLSKVQLRAWSFLQSRLPSTWRSKHAKCEKVQSESNSFMQAILISCRRSAFLVLLTSGLSPGAVLPKVMLGIRNMEHILIASQIISWQTVDVKYSDKSAGVPGHKKPEITETSSPVEFGRRLGDATWGPLGRHLLVSCFPYFPLSLYISANSPGSAPGISNHVSMSVEQHGQLGFGLGTLVSAGSGPLPSCWILLLENLFNQPGRNAKQKQKVSILSRNRSGGTPIPEIPHQHLGE